MGIVRECMQCNNLFGTDISRLKRGRGKYCSLLCHGAARTAATLAKRPKLQQPTDYRLIPLAGGHVTKVSVEDYEELSLMSWQRDNSGYVRHNGQFLMHQVIMNKVCGEYAPLIPDHINRNPLDNRRENLRLVTVSQNAQNRSRKSTYVGIHRQGASFRAAIHFDGERLYIGSFSTPEDAAYVRDQFAIALHGQHAVLNFEY